MSHGVSVGNGFDPVRDRPAASHPTAGQFTLDADQGMYVVLMAHCVLWSSSLGLWLLVRALDYPVRGRPRTGSRRCLCGGVLSAQALWQAKNAHARTGLPLRTVHWCQGRLNGKPGNTEQVQCVEPDGVALRPGFAACK
jgi:hypothetical protein